MLHDNRLVQLVIHGPSGTKRVGINVPPDVSIGRLAEQFAKEQKWATAERPAVMLMHAEPPGHLTSLNSTDTVRSAGLTNGSTLLIVPETALETIGASGPVPAPLASAGTGAAPGIAPGTATPNIASISALVLAPAIVSWLSELRPDDQIVNEWREQQEFKAEIAALPVPQAWPLGNWRWRTAVAMATAIAIGAAAYWSKPWG